MLVRATKRRRSCRHTAKLFEPLRQAYRRGTCDDFERVRHGLESQRRRLFFSLDDEGGDPSELSPWRLSVFQYGGVYLAFMDALATMKAR